MEITGHALDIEIAPRLIGNHIFVGAGIEIGDDIFDRFATLELVGDGVTQPLNILAGFDDVRHFT